MNLKKGVVQSEGRIAPNTLLSGESCIVDEKLLIRRERRTNKCSSGHREQRSNQVLKHERRRHSVEGGEEKLT